jgi:tetratricopeptide (TPR) repeat protein
LYTTNTFVFRFINQALRDENIGAILLSHFIIVDLFKELQKGYDQFLNMHNNLQSRRYYRGQQMSVSELEEMKLSIGEFIIVKSFFSATVDLAVALAFAGSHGNKTKNENLFILFKIIVDLSVNNVPFSDLTAHSLFKDEREVLFAAGSMFCIEDITYDTNIKVWVLRISLVNENDQRVLDRYDCENMSALSLSSQISKVGHLIRCKLNGSVSNSNLYCNSLLKELPLDNLCQSACYSDLGWNAYHECEYALALSNQQIALEICDASENSDEQNELRRVIFNAFGVIYHSMHKYELAFEYYNKASDLNVSSVIIDQYSLKRKFLNNPTFNLARWHKMSNNFELALIYYGNLVKTATLRENVQISLYEQLSRWYDGNFIVNRTQNEHKIAFIDFSTKYLPQFHNEIATAYESINKHDEALKIFLNYAPSDERSIISCYKSLVHMSHEMGDFSHEIEYSEKYFELLKSRSEVIWTWGPARIYARVASAYFSTGQTALAIDRLEKAIEGYKAQYQLETTPDMPYRCVVRNFYNDSIAKGYIQLADIYRDTGNSEAADHAMRMASTDQIIVDEELDHDRIISDLTTNNTSRDVFDQKVIDSLLIAQTQVKQTNIFKCLNGHELQWTVHGRDRSWSCDKCGRFHHSHVPKWRCWCVPHCYDKCDICITKELFYFNSKLLDNILREDPQINRATSIQAVIPKVIVSEYTWYYSLLYSRLFILFLFFLSFLTYMSTIYVFFPLVLSRILPVVFSWFIP